MQNEENADEENGSFDSGSACAQDDMNETEDGIDETEDVKPSEPV